MKPKRCAGLALLVLLLITQSLSAETPTGRFEAGLVVTGAHLHKINEKPLGLGGRFFFDLTPHAALDFEVTDYPEDPSGNFGETTILFGGKAGSRFDRFGVFGKARAGMIHFGGSAFDLRLERKTVPLGDVGAVL